MKQLFPYIIGFASGISALWLSQKAVMLGDLLIDRFISFDELARNIDFGRTDIALDWNPYDTHPSDSTTEAYHEH